MKKLAIFVEGQTELIFVKKFIEEIAGQQRVEFRLATIRGALPSQLVQMSGHPQAASVTNRTHFVLIFNCEQDGRVKSTILDRYDTLTKAGYDLVLGLRDLYPTPLSDIDKVKMGLRTRIPTKGLPINILLSVAEIEAWFIREHSHFQRVDPRLDVQTIASTFGFDPRVDDVERIAHPSDFLHKIYRLAGKAYNKTRSHVQRTVDAIDYAALYIEGRNNVPHLNDFVTHIDQFLSSV